MNTLAQAIMIDTTADLAAVTGAFVLSSNLLIGTVQHHLVNK